METLGGLVARTKIDTQLHSRSSRAKLAIDKEPYWMTLEKGRALGYRKGKTSGEWVARYYDPLLKPSKRYQPLGTADDYADPNGVTILSFSEAQAKAREWFKLAYQEATGETIKTGKFTVKDAIDAYLEDRRRHGAKTADRMHYEFNAHVIPHLGDIPLERITRKRIEDWMDGLAKAPARRRGQEGAAPSTEDEIRSRKATVNRIWTSFKAALNLAAKERGCSSTVWSEVRAFRGTQVARIRFLSLEEQQRLIRACEAEDFQALLKAGLYTGAREGELARLTTRDFSPERKDVFFEKTKSRKSRHAPLTDEGAAFFVDHTRGKGASDVLFPRTIYDRKDKRNMGGWSRSEISRMMKGLCVKAEVDPLKFHELRHTYASTLINAGISLFHVAQQLGHRDTKMVEKHYGHLCQTALAQAIRQKAPNLGIHSGSGQASGA